MDDVNISIRKKNKVNVLRYGKCDELINKLKTVELFLEDMQYLSAGRNYVRCEKSVFSLHRVLISAELTMGSIISCCESACIADAYSLLRKYRDDLFFYLYVSVYDADKAFDDKSKRIKDMKENILKWLEDGLDNFYINFLLKSISTSPALSDGVVKFELKQSFDNIGTRLNNYVHSKGYSYYNMSYIVYKDFRTSLESLINDAEYITMSFLFLLILSSPLSIMSTDYIDYYECGQIPPEGCQYLVAPFVEKFINLHIKMIDDNCLAYLRENTSMQL